MRCETWHGLIFLNLSGDAAPLAEHMAPITRRYSDFDFSEMRFGGVQTYEFAANWETADREFRRGLPSALDPSIPEFHLVHGEPLQASSMNPIVGQGSDLYERDKAGHEVLPQFSGLTRALARAGRISVLAAEHAAGVHVDHITVWGIYPDGTDRAVRADLFLLCRRRGARAGIRRGAGQGGKQPAQHQSRGCRAWSKACRRDVHRRVTSMPAFRRITKPVSIRSNGGSPTPSGKGLGIV